MCRGLYNIFEKAIATACRGFIIIVPILLPNIVDYEALGGGLLTSQIPRLADFD
jgi:hypothetical protein